jgi:CBS domain-containing protein
MKAQEIMARNPRCVTPRTSVQEAARLMKSEDVGALPVVESDNSQKLVGIITDRDIALRVVAEGRDAAGVVVSDVMSKGATSAKATDSVDDVMKTMGREQVRRIPIVDERDQLVGIVSQADIVRKAQSDSKSEHTVEKISEPGGRHS